MRDSDIVALLVSDDSGAVRRGLEAAYAAYADRIHDYAHGMLRTADPAAAADVTHDTFLIAQAKAPGLRDPERLRPWLYAIARNECLRVLRQTKRRDPLEYDDGTTHLALAAAEAEGSPDMSGDLDRADLRTLVAAAAAGLSPKDREVFDLGLRHDLRAPEVAAALGVSDNAAHAMLSRVRGQFERALGALSVARHGRQSCAELDQLLTGWDGEFDALWRKRIARHVDSCDTCSAVQKREVSPAALLSVLPLVAAPVLVRDRLFSDDLDLVAASRPSGKSPSMSLAESLAERAGPFDRDGGFPGAVGARRRRGALVLLGVLLLIGSVGTISWLALGQTPEQEVTSRRSLPDATTTGPSYDVGPNTTLSPTGSVTPSPTGSESASPTPTTASPSDGVTPSTSDEPTPNTPTSTQPTSPGQPTPTRQPTRNPTTAPPTTAPPTTPPAEPPAGVLRVTPQSFNVTPSGGDFTVRVSAVNGPVDWTTALDAAAAQYVAVSPDSGSLAEGASASVTLSVSPITDRRVNQMVVTFNPGGIRVTITVVRRG